jgi:hypothetical protein
MRREGDIVRYTAEELAAKRACGATRSDYAKAGALTNE